MAMTSAPLEAQVVVPYGTYTGGSNFSTSVTAGLSYLGNGILQLDLINNGPGVFAAIGLVNVTAGSVSPGSAPSGWTWNTTSQLTGDGLPASTWAWIAPKPAPHNGAAPGDPSMMFTFDIGNLDWSDMGFAVHAVSGPNDCSTKFGVWNGGASTNDAGPNYDPACTVAVPEPNAAWLFATGLLGLAYVRRRRAIEWVEGNA